MVHDIFPIFLSGYPCRNHCAYCNAAGSSGVTDPVDWVNLDKEINQWVQHSDTSDKREIAIYGNDLLSIPELVLEQLFARILKLRSSCAVDAIRTSLRPDSILQMKESQLRAFSIIEIGIPSMDPRVLKLINRGHDVEVVQPAVDKLRSLTIETGLQTMLGLPGASRDTDIESARIMTKMLPDFARIHPAIVLRGTLLQVMLERNEYQPLDLEEAVCRSSDVWDIYSNCEIPVVRCGFHLPENVRENVFIAGPWHPAFGQLVRSRRWRSSLSEILKDQDDLNILVVPERELSNAIGQKSSNVKWLSEKFGRKIRIVSKKKRIM
ncbi:radical SAM protein [bacterium]|nr:radical SAM protein [bacterium]